jgi:hypothetical protein
MGGGDTGRSGVGLAAVHAPAKSRPPPDADA